MRSSPLLYHLFRWFRGVVVSNRPSQHPFESPQ
jgi:hypothetical protein